MIYPEPSSIYLRRTIVLGAVVALGFTEQVVAELFFNEKTTQPWLKLKG